MKARAVIAFWILMLAVGLGLMAWAASILDCARADDPPELEPSPGWVVIPETPNAGPDSVPARASQAGWQWMPPEIPRFVTWAELDSVLAGINWPNVSTIGPATWLDPVHTGPPYCGVTVGRGW